MMVRVIALLLICALFVPMSARAETLWLNAQMAVADPGLTVTQAQGTGSIRVVSTNPGTTQWIYFPAAIPSNWEANSVELCYALSDPNSYITQIRVTEMQTPDGATVIRDDGTDLTDTGPSCVTSSVFARLPEGILTISIRFQFQDMSDEIEIGGIGLNFTPPVVSVGEGTPIAERMQLQNYPNPFASSTNIEFRVPEAGEVRVQVYSPSGQLIRSIDAGRMESGLHRVAWDARNDAGVRMPPGVYFHVVRVGEHVGSKRMVLAR